MFVSCVARFVNFHSTSPLNLRGATNNVLHLTKAVPSIQWGLLRTFPLSGLLPESHCHTPPRSPRALWRRRGRQHYIKRRPRTWVGSVETFSNLCTFQTTTFIKTRWIDEEDHTERPRRAILSSMGTSSTAETPTARRLCRRSSSRCLLAGIVPVTRYRSTRQYVFPT